MKTWTRFLLISALTLGLTACGMDYGPDIALYNPDGTPIVPGQTQPQSPNTPTANPVQSSFFIYFASMQPGGQFQIPVQDPTSGNTYYLRQRPLITYTDLTNAVPVKDPLTNAAYALLTLNPQGAQRLLTATRQFGEPHFLVVMLQRQMISIIQITQPLSTQLRIPASSPYRAYQIVQKISDGD